MKYTSTIYKAIAFSLLFFSTSIISAEEQINFKDAATAKNILLDTRWECGLGDGSGWGGQSVWNFEEINGNKVTGTVNLEYCRGYDATGTTISRTDAKLKGKLKKDTLKFTAVVNQGPCVTFSGKLKFVREDATSYRADGIFSRKYQGNNYKGTLFCYVRNT